MKLTSVVASIVCVCCSMTVLAFGGIDLAAVKQTDKARYIVKFQSSVSTIPAVLSDAQITPIRQLNSINAVVTRLTTNEVIQLRQRSEIAYIEPDPIRHIQEDDVPYDEAQIQTIPLSEGQGGNRKVCIIDTGFDMNHEDSMKVQQMTGEVIDSMEERSSPGVWSEDEYGHGTQVTGIISSIEHQIGVSDINIGNRLQLHHVKIIHNPNYWSIWGSDMIAAVDACQAAGAHVINMSIAGSDNSQAEQQAMDQARQNGVLLFASSGHRGNAQPFYPAGYESVVSVGVVDEHRKLTVSDAKNLSKESGDLNGTSMATAFASGVAALVWSYHHECSGDEILQALLYTANTMNHQSSGTALSYGQIQAKDALAYLNTSAMC